MPSLTLKTIHSSSVSIVFIKSCLMATKLLQITLAAASLHWSTVGAFSSVARSAWTASSSCCVTSASSPSPLFAGSFYDSPQTTNINNISNNSNNNPAVTAKTPLKKKDLRTLARFLEVECWKSPGIRKLDRALLAVSDACKQINRIVQRAQTDDLYGAALDPLTGKFIMSFFISSLFVLLLCIARDFRWFLVDYERNHQSLSCPTSERRFLFGHCCNLILTSSFDTTQIPLTLSHSFMIFHLY